MGTQKLLRPAPPVWWGAKQFSAEDVHLVHSGSNPALPPCLLQVPTIVKFIHRWLVSNKDVSSEHRLDKSLLELTHAHPSDVVVTLLCSAPSCERYGAHLPLEPITLQAPSHVICQTDGEFQDPSAASFPSSSMSVPACSHAPSLTLKNLSLGHLPTGRDRISGCCQREALSRGKAGGQPVAA